jgi:hypothetical protein
MTDYTLPTEFLFITDPGHSWLVADVDDANAVGLSIYEFSNCSFIQDGVLFLEEDCDATLFALAYEATTGRKPELRFQDVSHFARSRPRLPGWGDTGFDAWAQKCKALDLLIASRNLAEGEAA